MTDSVTPNGCWWDQHVDFFSDEALWEQESRKTLMDFFLKFAKSNVHKRVLDVGCGTGISTKRLNQMGFQAVGLDVSPKMVDYARTNSLEVFLSDCNPIPFHDESFNFVFCCTVLEWVQNPAALVSEMIRVTRSGGRIVIACLGPRNLPFDEAYNRLLGEQSNYNMLMPVELHRMLESLGLKIKSIKGVRNQGVSEEMYDKMDWITKSFCSNLWIIGCEK
ncbi:class I SAM-dependent methyltransferase [Paenibacillus sp. SYP-B3998]|uniref:Class I SAM-dependent methyltransferase n=1 Tax=Paenibacillus sp. SYP-B3998 TaxID=2678564 RepID=A0A6G3ZZT5_9BACL|nr:class I SAM-dependent methyltransferase [Paenibacillus sp. SYP-B3998]NEW06917.1 class I SAM-dependent methyltransferase [Paenibacillus sp. SYP-B3998]